MDQGVPAPLFRPLFCKQRLVCAVHGIGFFPDALHVALDKLLVLHLFLLALLDGHVELNVQDGILVLDVRGKLGLDLELFLAVSQLER